VLPVAEETVLFVSALLAAERCRQGVRRVSLCQWRIGAITAGAVVLLHHQHGRTTSSNTGGALTGNGSVGGSA
jgi:hypothetical protein